MTQSTPRLTQNTLRSQNTVDVVSTTPLLSRKRVESENLGSALRNSQIEEEQDIATLEVPNEEFDEVNDTNAAGQEELELQASIREMQLTSSGSYRQIAEENETEPNVLGTLEEHAVSDTGDSGSDQYPTTGHRRSDSETVQTTNVTRTDSVPKMRTLSTTSSAGGAQPSIGRLDSTSSLVDLNLAEPNQTSCSAPSLFAVLGTSDVTANCTMCRCARIQGLDNFEGLMVFFREHFYIVDGYTMLNGEVKDIEFLTSGTFSSAKISKMRINLSMFLQNFKCLINYTYDLFFLS